MSSRQTADEARAFHYFNYLATVFQIPCNSNILNISGSTSNVNFKSDLCWSRLTILYSEVITAQSQNSQQFWVSETHALCRSVQAVVQHLNHSALVQGVSISKSAYQAVRTRGEYVTFHQIYRRVRLRTKLTKERGSDQNKKIPWFDLTLCTNFNLL